MERVSIDAILSGEPETDETPASTPERDESGKFVSKSEKGVEPEPVQEAAPEPEVPPTEDKLPEDVYKPLRAVRDENKALKEQLEALNNKINTLSQEPQAPPPSMWEDDQAWQAHFQQSIMRQADQLSRINASEMAARAQYPDFQEKYDQFNRMAAENPAIVQQAMSDPHPWNKAYQIAQNAITMQEMGATDLATMKAKLREELLAELQAQVPVTAPKAPPSLVNERSVGSRSGPAWSGPKSLDELLG